MFNALALYIWALLIMPGRNGVTGTARLVGRNGKIRGARAWDQPESLKLISKTFRIQIGAPPHPRRASPKGRCDLW